MIATISGVVAQLLPQALLVEVNGLGYEVRVAADDISMAIGTPVKLWVHEHIREDSHDLYGFATQEAKLVFEQLLGVSGVGPKVALAILSSLGVSGVSGAVSAGNVAVLQGAPGVGKRMAERLVVELRNKLVTSIETSGILSLESDAAHGALVSLGYSTRQASEVLARIPSDITTDEDKIKFALRELGGNR